MGLNEPSAAAYYAGKLAVVTGGGSGDLRAMVARMSTDFRDKAPLSPAGAATIILDGVRSGSWRILVGEDARKLDEMVRAHPEAAYDYAELARLAQQAPPARPAG